MSAVPADVWRTPRALSGGAADPWRDAALVFAILFVPTLAALALDGRELNGISVWIKPLKFQAALVLHFVTLMLLARLLPEARLRARSFRAVVAASAAAGLFEIAYIMLQAARGRASHFNDETVLEQVMYALMGIGSVVLVAAPFAMGVWLLRDRSLRLMDPLRLGAALGLVISAVATLIVAGYLSASGAHWVGDVATDAGGLPLVGWSQRVGDLRVAHFFATHTLQVLPLVGWLARAQGARGRRYVTAAAALLVLVTAAVFAQALLGRPFLVLG